MHLLVEILAYITRFLDPVTCGRLVLQTSKTLTAQIRVYVGAWLFDRDRRMRHFLAEAARTLLANEVLTLFYPTAWQRSVLQELSNEDTLRLDAMFIHVRRFRKYGWRTLMDHLVDTLANMVPRQEIIVFVEIERETQRYVHKQPNVHIATRSRLYHDWCVETAPSFPDAILFAHRISIRYVTSEAKYFDARLVVRDTSHRPDVDAIAISCDPHEKWLGPYLVVSDKSDSIGF